MNDAALPDGHPKGRVQPSPSSAIGARGTETSDKGPYFETFVGLSMPSRDGRLRIVIPVGSTSLPAFGDLRQGFRVMLTEPPCGCPECQTTLQPEPTQPCSSIPPAAPKPERS